MNYKINLLKNKNNIAIWGTGYIGLSTMMYFAKKGVSSVGFDVDSKKVRQINKGILPINELKDWFGFDIKPFIKKRLLSATSNLSDLQDKKILALDCKMSFDNNALFRRNEVSELRDKSQEDSREVYASDRGLSYVGLDGDIGNIINGAGLAMASMDMIKLAGGEPANFLDIGGGATPEKIVKAFKLVTSDKKVKVILVNIFAGINRCDWVADGIVQALKKIKIEMPLVIRLAGTNVDEGKKILKDSKINYIEASTLEDAANRAVKALKEIESK